MSITNALAGVAVKELEPAVAWYTRMLDIGPSMRTIPEVAEWRFASGGWLQLFVDARRAGSSSVTFVTTDADATAGALNGLRIPVRERTKTADVSTVIVHDPDGNRIVFAEARSERNLAARAQAR